MEELFDRQSLEAIQALLFFFFIIITAVGINITIEVIKVRNDFMKVDFENQFQVQRFANQLIQNRLLYPSIKVMLLKGLREDCKNQNFDHIVTKIDVALNDVKKKG